MNTAEVSNDVEGVITTLSNCVASAPLSGHGAVPDLPNELIFKVIAIFGHEYLDAEVLDASFPFSFGDKFRRHVANLESLLQTLLNCCLAARILRQEALRYIWRRVRVMDEEKLGQWGMSDSKLSTLFPRRLLGLFPLISRTDTNTARCASLTSVLPHIKELSIEIHRAYGIGGRDSPADRFGSGALLEVLKIFSSTSNVSGPQGSLEKLTFIFDVNKDISFMDLPGRFQRVLVSLIRSMGIPFTPPRDLEILGIYGIPLELFLDERNASTDCPSIPRRIRLLTSRKKLSKWTDHILRKGRQNVQYQGDDPNMNRMWRQLGVKLFIPELGGVKPMVDQERSQVDSERTLLANPVEALETDFETLNWGNTENMECLLKVKFSRLKEFIGVIWNSQALQKMNHLLSGASTSLEVVQIALAVSQGTVSKIYVLPSLRNLSFSLYYSLENPYTHLCSWERNKANPAMDMILDALGHGQTDAQIGSPLESFRLAVYWHVYEYLFHSEIFGKSDENHWTAIDDVLSSNLYPKLSSVSLVIVIERSDPHSDHGYTEPTYAEVDAEKKDFEEFGPDRLIENWLPKLSQKEQDTQGGFTLSVVYSTERCVYV